MLHKAYQIMDNSILTKLLLFMYYFKGPPVDDIDTACRAWHKCNQCTTMDNKNCVGVQQKYGDILIDTDTYEFSCQSSGPVGSCEYNACSCDVNLAETLYTLANSFNQANHFNNFDIGQCTTVGTGLTIIHNECCGSYPNRFPFNTENGARGCCHGKTFDSENLMCCVDGRIDVACETDGCQANNCLYGECFSTTTGYECTCNPGWSGQYCDQVSTKYLVPPHSVFKWSYP